MTAGRRAPAGHRHRDDPRPDRARRRRRHAAGRAVLGRGLPPRGGAPRAARAPARGRGRRARRARRDRRRDGPRRVHRAAGRARDGQGAGLRPRHPDRRHRDRRGAAGGGRRRRARPAPAGRSLGPRPDPRRGAAARSSPAATSRSSRPASGWSPSTSTAARPTTRSRLGSRPWTASRRRCCAAGAARLAAGDPDDLATLVPEYVTLPRGVRAAAADAGVAIEGRAGRRQERRDDRVRRPGPPDPADDGRRTCPPVQLIERASFTTPWPPQAYRQELESNRLAHYLVGTVDERGRRLRRHLAHGRRGARHDVRGPPALSPPPDRGAAAARRSWTCRSTATPARRRSRSGCPTSARGGCTRSTASGRSGIRPRYYCDNQEDALIMTTEPLSVARDARADRPPPGRARRRPAAGPAPDATLAPAEPSQAQPGRDPNAGVA